MDNQVRSVFRAWIDENDPSAAVSKIIEGIGTDAPSLTFVFVDPEYDLDGLAEALHSRVRGPVLACTTAGQLVSENGYASGGMAVAAIHSPQLEAHLQIIEDVTEFGVIEAQQLGEALAEHLVGGRSDQSLFGVLLVDGMCRREERLAALIQGACGGISFVGGSAGDGGKFLATHVFDGSRFRSKIAAFALIKTTLPYQLFRFQHFKPSAERLVVTKADSQDRRLIELNGEPARLVYCRQIGCAELDENIVGRHPLLVQCGEEYYARGIQSWDETTLNLFCSIEEGMVVRIGEGTNLIDTLQGQLEGLASGCGAQPTLTVAFDCILRRLEVQKRKEDERFRQIIDRHPVVGFSTYGEQFDGLHINQTMTGFAIAA